MNHAEFHAAAAKIAAGRYFSTQVEANTHKDGSTKVEWSLYIDGRGWTQDHLTPEAALTEALQTDRPGVESIGASPEPTPEASERLAHNGAER